MEYINEAEAKAIALQFSKSRGDKGFTADEYVAIINEAERIRIEGCMLDLVISGAMICDWDGKEFRIRPENK